VLYVPAPLRRTTVALGTTVVLLLSGFAGLVSVGPAQAASTGLVISRVYGAGGNGGATLNSDYIELFNRGSAAVSTTDLSVQYASSAGTSWAVTTLGAHTVPAGGYLLVKESGGANGAAIPPPDVTGTIAMAAAAGKVALVSATTALSCGATCATFSGVVDFVGYGSANDREGIGTAPAPSPTLDDERKAGGCTDTDDNAADFAAVSPAPRTSSTPVSPCSTVPTDAAPRVVSTSPASGATNVPVNFDVRVTFNEPVSIDPAWGTLECTVSGAHAAAVSGGPTTFSINPATDLAYGDTCTLTLTAGAVHDLDQVDPPDTLATESTTTFSTPATNPCGTPATHTYVIQGPGTTSPLDGQTVTTEGIVVADFQGADKLSGFAIQDGTGDGNLDTSDGLFVFGSAAPDVAVGDVVRVTGRISEFRNQTELTYSSLAACGTTEPPAATPLHLPVADRGDQEHYEGMLVTVPETLTVQQNFFLGRFGQLSLGAGGRRYQPTNLYTAGSPAAVQLADENARSLITLDDATSLQNPDPTPYLDADNTRRAGNIVDGVTGMLDEGPINTSTTTNFGYRIEPTTAPTFGPGNERTSAPEPVGGNLQVGFFNVLNYFTTLNPTNDQSAGAPRGANSEAEFTRQKAKIVAAMSKLDADVVGLSEIENLAGTNAVQDLVDGLNSYIASHGGPATTYAAVPDPATGTGTDAIKVAMIYKPAVVEPVGTSISDTTAINNRPPLAQEFRLLANRETVNVVVNHLKSKGSCPNDSDLGNRDNGDGQGCWNAQRVAQAEQLLDFIETVKARSGDDDVLAIGDFNSYGHEDPIETLKDRGLTNEIEKHIGDRAYSYVFDGLSGYLDHGLATASADGQVVGAKEWHINADEPSVIDYNTEFKDFGSETRYGPDYYTPTPYRSSDHDPVLLGVDLGRCQYSVDSATKTRTLLGDCTTSETVLVPNGWTLDGAGHSITAYDPAGGAFSGAVVANGGATADVRNLTVTSYRLTDHCDGGTAALRGILLDGASGAVRNSRVVDLRQNGSGCQEGNAIEARNGGSTATTVTLDANTVTRYQKTGILVNGLVQATVTRNSVQGLGPVSYIAQNGVQVSRGATALVDDNGIADNFYTGPDSACGLLVFEASGVKQKRNTFSGNEQDFCNIGRGGGGVSVR
jgi:predicted extracellular nuclease